MTKFRTELAEPVSSAKNGRGGIAASALLALVRFYIAVLAPFLGGACKFYPSCSNYAREALETHGARRGFLLAARRLLRCHPFRKGGFDPVPPCDRERREIDQSAQASDGRRGLLGVQCSPHNLPSTGERN